MMERTKKKKKKLQWDTASQCLIIWISFNRCDKDLPLTG